MKIIPLLILTLTFAFVSLGQEKIRVISEKANVRDLPSTTAGIVVYKVTEGTELELLIPDHRDGWYAVVNPRTKKRGWIHGNSIEFITEEEEVDTSPVRTRTVVTKTQTVYVKPCRTAEYQNMTNDSGFDRAVYLGKTYAFINQSGSYLNLLNLDTSEMVKAHCSDAQIYLTQKEKSKADNFVRTCEGYAGEPPEISIENGTNRILTLYIDEIKYEFPAYTTRKIAVNSGAHYFVAAAPRVIPLTGNKNWESGCSYSWKFWIQ